MTGEIGSCLTIITKNIRILRAKVDYLVKLDKDAPPYQTFNANQTKFLSEISRHCQHGNKRMLENYFPSLKNPSLEIGSIIYLQKIVAEVGEKHNVTMDLCHMLQGYML